MAFSVGRLRPTTSTRKEYAKVEGLLTRSLWSGRAGQGLFTVLTSVGKYPVASVDHHKAWLGDAPASTRIEDRLYTLVSEGMIEVVAESAYASDGNLLKTWIRLAPASPMAQGRLDDLVRLKVIEVVVGEMGESGYAYVPKEEQARKRKPLKLGLRDWARGVPMAISQRGQGKPRFVLTTKGRTQLRYALGGSTENLYNWTNLGLVESGRWSIQHEDCAYEVLAQCAEMGCPIAPHWKVKITLATAAALSRTARCWSRHRSGGGSGATWKSNCRTAPPGQLALGASGTGLRIGWRMAPYWSWHTTSWLSSIIRKPGAYTPYAC